MPASSQSARASKRAPRSARTRWSIRAAKALAGVVLTPALLVLPLRWIAPPTTAIMLQQSSCDTVRYRWQPAMAIPTHAAWAALAAEDQRFFLHGGFDFESIQRALDERRRRTRGASTISQQVAKNLFLWPGRSLVRKGIEAYFTLWLELLLPKQRILEIYLNIAELGPCTFGVEAASQRYFRKPAARLTPRESALLAATLPNPMYRSLEPASAYITRRSQQILAQAPKVPRPVESGWPRPL